MRTTNTVALLLAALAAPVALRAQGAGMQATGTMRLLWEDPAKPGAFRPRRIAMLTDAAGRTRRVRMDADVARRFGGLEALDGRRVTLRLAARGARAPADASEPLEATAIESAMPAPRLPSLPVVGAKRYATLLCRFADFPDVTPGSREQFDRIVSSPEYPSVNHYWTENSRGRVTMNGSRAYGWYTLPHERAHYVNPSGSGVNFPALDQDCMDAADADVHFPDYDGVNIVVNTNLDGRLFAGGSTYERDGVTKPFMITYLDGAVTFNVGLTAHEVGHNFGLGHTSGGNGTPYDSQWDVMSYAGFYHAPDGKTILPAHTLAWQKNFLGFIPPERYVVVAPGTTTLRVERSALPADNADALMVVVPVPGAAGQEYYTIEVRGGPGSGYDAGIPEASVLVNHFANFEGLRVVDLDGNGDPNDAGAQLTVGETFVDRRNDISIRVDEQVGAGFRVTVTVPDRGAVAVSPRSRNRVVAFGDRAGHVDSASVTVEGASAATTPWRAELRWRRLGIATATGTGSGVLRWTSSAAELAPGTYVDSIAVIASGVADSVAYVLDSLVVEPPAALSVGLSAQSQLDSATAGSAPRYFAVNVAPSGPGADTATWTATKRAAWIELLESTDWLDPVPRLRFRHVPTGLAPGLYVDTIVASISSGATAAFVDTLRVMPPLAVSLARASGSARAPQGSVATTDSVLVTVSGTWADRAQVTATQTSAAPIYLGGDPRGRVGSGWLRIRRAPGNLAPGLYVNRLRIGPALDPTAFAEYVDTLLVEAAAPAIRLDGYSRRDSVVIGSWVSMDSVLVLPQGPDAASRQWTSTYAQRRIYAMFRNGLSPYGSGTGMQYVVWQRNLTPVGSNGIPAPRAPGLYVDTIWVKFASGDGDSARVVDSVVVLGTPSLTVAARSRSAAAMVGRAATSSDSVAVAPTGWNVDGASWSAAHSAAWSTLTTATGAGPGMVRWTRDAGGLAAGVHVDTITVASPGLVGSPQVILDSLRVWPTLAIAGDAARRTGIMGADYADTIRVEGGTAAAATFAAAGGALPTGVSLAAATGELKGVPEAVGEFRFTVRARSDTFSVERELTLSVAAPAVTAAQVLDKLLGDGALEADRVRYLDLLGNRNGRLDVGDVRAWLQANAAASADPAAKELRALAGAAPPPTPRSKPRENR
ncbi:MAG: putative Ig domain-containing protein [Gemmatimonadaceae bacterium]